jgi:hypothetical protein
MKQQYERHEPAWVSCVLLTRSHIVEFQILRRWERHRPSSLTRNPNRPGRHKADASERRRSRTSQWSNRLRPAAKTGRQPSSCFCSQRRAKSQSSRTARTVAPSTSAVSSSEHPRKYRRSTTEAARVSISWSRSSSGARSSN